MTNVCIRDSLAANSPFFLMGLAPHVIGIAARVAIAANILPANFWISSTGLTSISVTLLGATILAVKDAPYSKFTFFMSAFFVTAVALKILQMIGNLLSPTDREKQLIWEKYFFLSTLSQIKDLETQESLSLENTKLSTIPEEISDLTNLKKLSLKRTNLYEFPSAICSLTSLEELDLSETSIGHLDDNIGLLLNLKKLVLNSTSLNRFPKALRYLPNLEELDLRHLSGWIFDGLEDVAPHLKKLKRIDFSNSKFLGHTAGFEKLPSGCVVDFRGTHIDALEIEKMEDAIHYERLISRGVRGPTLLYDKQVIKSEPQPRDRTDYTRIDLKNERIGALAPEISELHSLSYFSLFNCAVTSLPEEITTLTNLKALRIYANDLNSLPQ
jgi:Leucine-rich repeat (LRR) protein